MHAASWRLRVLARRPYALWAQPRPGRDQGARACTGVHSTAARRGAMPAAPAPTISRARLSSSALSSPT